MEGRACMSVGNRELSGSSGGTAVVTSSLRRPVKERLGNMVHSDDSKAETDKVGDLIFIITCYILNYRCL